MQTSFNTEPAAETHKKSSRLLPYLIALSLVAFLAEFIFFMSQRSDYFQLAKSADHHFAIPVFIWFSFILFWIVEIALHIFLALIVWAVTRLLAYQFKWSWQNTCRCGFILWIAAFIDALLLNQCFYAASVFAIFIQSLLPFFLAKTLVIILSMFLIIILLMALLIALRYALKKRPRISMVVFLFFLIIYSVFYFIENHQASVQNSDQPNVFIIGIDAIRPDHVGFYGDTQNDTPQLDAFFQQATNFMDAITPLARTYPAWISILTGELPKQNGVRFDLTSLAPEKIQQDLPMILRQHGYHTIFAMDGRRFVSIDQSFGFDQVVGPSVNLNNFLIGAMSDFPLSNLVSNTFFGRLALPYSYANRDTFVTYRPEAFNHQIEEKLLHNGHRPVFLAAHFTLSHWPFAWADRPYNENLPLDTSYRIAVKRVDQQVAQLLTFLQDKGYLQHAIVILISDHGDAEGLAGDRLISENKFVKGPHSRPNIFQLVRYQYSANEPLDVAYGHGTDVLSYTQYRSVLAIRTYGMQANQKKRVNNRVLLTDIKATILQLLNIPYSNAWGTQSLVAYLYQKKVVNNPYPFAIIETGFTPPAVEANRISVFNAVQEGIGVFTIDPDSDEVVMKPAVAQDLLKTNKQRAIYYKNWVLAFYPQKQGSFLVILVNRQTGQWTDDLRSAFARQAPLSVMMQLMKKYYANELNGVNFN